MMRATERKLLRLVFATVLLSLLFVILAGGFFLYRTYTIETSPGATDAIVVLTGGRGRVEEGFRLYRAGQGRMLIVLGVSPSVTLHDLFGDRIREGDRERIVLEKGSRSTIENALFGRALFREKGVRSIRLITSRYHMVRSLFLFQRILGRDPAIIPHPVEWRGVIGQGMPDRSALLLLWSEAYKYWAYRLVFLFLPEV